MSGEAHALPSITGVEINQVLGVQKSNNKYFVAGKNTVVRVFLSEPISIDANQTGVRVWRDGNAVFDIEPVRYAQPTATIDFRCTSMQACKNWSAGAYNFQVLVNGNLERLEPATGSYLFKSSSQIRILAVPIKANYGGTIKSVPDDKWKTMWTFTEKVYPLGAGNLKWIPYPREFDASDGKYNLKIENGQKSVWEELSAFIPDKCKTNPQDASCYDYVVGFIPEKIQVSADDSLQGFTYGSPAFVVVAGDGDAPATVAHELAHIYGIGDTYDDAAGSSIRCSVNPAPPGFKGRDWDNNFRFFDGCTVTPARVASTLVYGPEKEKVNAAQVPQSAHPYEVGGRGALAEMADFMGSTALQSQMWITPDNYDWLYRRLVNKENIKAMRRNLLGPLQRLLSFSGFVKATGEVELAPWTTYKDTNAPDDTEDTYTIRAMDGGNNIIAKTGLDVRFWVPSRRTPLEWAPFRGVIRLPDNTVKLQIVKSGAVLLEVPVSANVPTVDSVTPTTRATLDGPFTITWNAADPEGGNLTYMVEYNRDVTDTSSPWIILVTGLTTQSWTEDFSEFPGGNHAKIRVTAGDGVLSASAESADFIVPVRGPEVFIDLPGGTTYTAGTSISLSVEAYDPQDDWLPDENLEWTSDLSGFLGYGSEIVISNLQTGTHKLTVTAANSAGLKATDSVVIKVEPPAGGQGSSGGGGSGCFIATAAFGSYLNPYVKVLRMFRDTILLACAPGSSFVAWYYRISPPLAEVIARHGALSAGVRIILLPAIGFAWLCLMVGVVPAVLILLVVVTFAFTVARMAWRRV
jgi:hypothetical protein